MKYYARRKNKRKTCWNNCRNILDSRLRRKEVMRKKEENREGKRGKERCGRIERESRMEALRKKTKNRRNKEKQRRRKGEASPGFLLRSRRRRSLSGKEGKRDEEEEIVGVPKMAPRGEAAVGGRR